MLRLVAILPLATVSFYMLFVWMLVYLTSIAEPPVAHAASVSTAGTALLVVLIPVGGTLTSQANVPPPRSHTLVLGPPYRQLNPKFPQANGRAIHRAPRFSASAHDVLPIACYTPPIIIGRWFR
jgi:hypothetical protein